MYGSYSFSNAYFNNSFDEYSTIYLSIVSLLTGV